jgi:VIT1/CCC1 family predicted Fe2+/Mn2+ transporter
MSNISEQSLTVIKKMQQNEITESAIYREIAMFAKGEENKMTLRRLAAEEKSHAEIWKKYTGIDIKPEKFKVFKYKWIARIFGFTFAIKLMERGEMNAQKEYESLKDEVPDSISVIKQEEEHEEALIQMLNEERLQYIGSMVLGMNDALVELTGSLAGFTLAMQNTNLIALAGLIIGISATFSMASSEFLSARSEGRKDAIKSCAYTGIAYLITVLLLILPYLLLGSAQYFLALALMMLIAIAIIAVFTYYISVAKDGQFKTRFLEMSLISVGVAVLSFVVGLLAKIFLGVEV